MAFRKFAALFGDRALALCDGNAVQDLLEPPPDALTVFEDGPDRWRVEAYFDVEAGERDLDEQNWRRSSTGRCRHSKSRRSLS